LKEEDEVKRMMAEIRGEEPPSEYGLEELEQAKKELESLQSKSEELKKQALKGMAELDLPISTQPEIDSEGNVVTTLEGGPYEKSLEFIADKFDSSLPLDIDGVLLNSNRIVVAKIRDLRKGLQKLLDFKQNIRRMALVSAGEKSPEIEKVVEYIRNSAYVDIWEAVCSKQKVVFENLYEELGITDSGAKKRVQNFFTNGRAALADAFPFINIRAGVWERTFFGSLVCRRYRTLHPNKKEEATEISRATEEIGEGEVEAGEGKTEPKIQPLNKYMETKELDRILYGNAGR